MKIRALTGLFLLATVGCGTENPFAAVTPRSYENIGAREQGTVLADGRSCAFNYTGTPLTVADYAALPGLYSPIDAEVTILTRVDYVYGPVNGNSGGYGPGVDATFGLSSGTLADLWDTELDPGMAACCQDLIIAAKEQGEALTVSGIGSGLFGQSDEAVVFYKLQTCALGLGSIAPSRIRLKGSGLQCSLSTTKRTHDGLQAELAIMALAALTLTKRRRQFSSRSDRQSLAVGQRSK